VYACESFKKVTEGEQINRNSARNPIKVDAEGESEQTECDENSERFRMMKVVVGDGEENETFFVSHSFS
jgi:hypothetical protein